MVCVETVIRVLPGFYGRVRYGTDFGARRSPEFDGVLQTRISRGYVRERGGSQSMLRRISLDKEGAMTNRSSWNTKLAIRWSVVVLCLVFWATVIFFIW